MRKSYSIWICHKIEQCILFQSMILAALCFIAFESSSSVGCVEQQNKKHKLKSMLVQCSCDAQNFVLALFEIFRRSAIDCLDGVHCRLQSDDRERINRFHPILIILFSYKEKIINAQHTEFFIRPRDFPRRPTKKKKWWYKENQSCCFKLLLCIFIYLLSFCR